MALGIVLATIGIGCKVRRDKVTASRLRKVAIADLMACDDLTLDENAPLLEAAFELFDYDKSGALDHTEVASLLRQL